MRQCQVRSPIHCCHTLWKSPQTHTHTGSSVLPIITQVTHFLAVLRVWHLTKDLYRGALLSRKSCFSNKSQQNRKPARTLVVFSFKAGVSRFSWSLSPHARVSGWICFLGQINCRYIHAAKREPESVQNVHVCCWCLCFPFGFTQAGKMVPVKTHNSRLLKPWVEKRVVWLDWNQASLQCELTSQCVTASSHPG